MTDYNENQQIEELVLDKDIDLEAIDKLYKSCPFPIVTVGKCTMYFNIKAAELITNKIRWYTTSEYVIGLPTTEDDKNGYSIRKDTYAATTVPATLRRAKKLKEGTYKLFKYKDGIAFKRYEQFKWKQYE